jgi:molecular chaperone HtpG
LQYIKELTNIIFLEGFMTVSDESQAVSQPIPFKAETRQLLDILIHSLYTEREIFLRELISNASDALTRVDFEILTNREVLDPDVDLSIRIVPDPDAKTLTISDTGIGMTEDDLVENLGTIAHSGAKAFMMAAQEGEKRLSDIIGRFGVGFYSAFMVAEWIRVVSRSHNLKARAAAWFSSGDDVYKLEPAERQKRGTDVIIKLREDAEEYLQETRLREIIKKHSDFIPFPIYIGESAEQVNRQTALWRQNPRQIEAKEYEDFYKQLTLDFEAPLAHAHMVVDAPVQMYAILFTPAKRDRGIFSLRKDDGLKLYSHKVLISEYSKELLPEYFRFVQGVVDSEDLPLNVSRESVQSNRVMAQLKKLVTSKVIDKLKKLASDDQEKYTQFWQEFGQYIKQGVAVEQVDPEFLYPLLRFRSTHDPQALVSLDDYVERMKPDQTEIYYILGDDARSVLYSPHLDPVKQHGYEVLLMTDPLDAFMTVRLTEYKGKPLSNVANADLKTLEQEKESEAEDSQSLPENEQAGLVERVKKILGEKIADVRFTRRLSESPARLVDPEGAPKQDLQRVYRMLREDFEIPKKVLELNARHPIILSLNRLPEESELAKITIEQIFENALLIEGLHPDPVGMIPRIQKLIAEALE